MTLLLGIDTASARFALALAEDGEVIASLERDAEQDHSQLLLPSIEDLLGPRSRELSGIVVVQGPGAYAGIRVGLATARGLALARGIPVRGISTLAAVARASGLDDVTAIHPAGRGEFAAQPFYEFEPAGPIGAAKPGDLAGLILAGEGAAELGGTEVGPEDRVRAALRALALTFEGQQAWEDVDALYLREPNITVPRRPKGPTAGA